MEGRGSTMKMAGQLLLTFVTFLIAESAFAKFTYEGYLSDAAGNPLISQLVSVRLQVRSPISTDCLLHQEVHAITTGADGYFSAVLGTVAPEVATGIPFNSLFQNSQAMTNSSSCVYTPLSFDSRNLAVLVSSDGGMTFETLGTLAVNQAPMAMSAETISGFSSTQILRGSAGVSIPVLSPTQAGQIIPLLNGSSSLYAQASQVGSGNNQIPVLDGTGRLPSVDGSLLTGVNAVLLRGGTIAVAAPTNGQVLQWNNTSLQWVPTTIAAGAVTSVTATAPVVAGGTAAAPVISMAAATTTVDGFLTSTDWNVFNNKMGTALTSGLVYVGNVGNVATARTLKMTDIYSIVTGPWFNISGACAAGQMPTYSSVADNFTCTAYNLTSGQVTTALGYSPASGTLPSGQIFVGNAGNVSTATAMSGDMSISNTGATTLANSSVSSAKIVDATIVDADIFAGAGIAATKLAGGLISNAEFDYLDGLTGPIQTQLTSLYAIGTISLAAGGPSNLTLRFAGDPDTGFYSPAADNISIQTGALERMTINSAGNVGIGVTTPADALHVVRNVNSIQGIRVENQNGLSAALSAIMLRNDVSSNGTIALPSSAHPVQKMEISSNISLGIDYIAQNATGKHTFITNPGVEQLIVDGGGIKAKSIASSHSAVAGGNLDLSLGNHTTTTFNCATPIGLANLRDGGSYRISVTDASNTMCTFATNSTGIDATTLTYRFVPANAIRTASSHTVYELNRFGNIVYVKWATGYMP